MGGEVVMGGWWWLCLPATWCPSCFSLCSPPTPLPSLPTPNPSYSPLIGLVVCGRLCACSGREKHVNLTHLAEFQTPTNCNCNFNCYHSIFYRLPKIIKMIICTLYLD